MASWARLTTIGEKESLSDEESTALAKSISLGSSWSKDRLEGKSLGTPSILSPEVLDEPISRREEGEEDEF